MRDRLFDWSFWVIGPKDVSEMDWRGRKKSKGDTGIGWDHAVGWWTRHLARDAELYSCARTAIAVKMCNNKEWKKLSRFEETSDNAKKGWLLVTGTANILLWGVLASISPQTR